MRGRTRLGRCVPEKERKRINKMIGFKRTKYSKKNYRLQYKEKGIKPVFQ